MIRVRVVHKGRLAQQDNPVVLVKGANRAPQVKQDSPDPQDQLDSQEREASVVKVDPLVHQDLLANLGLRVSYESCRCTIFS